MIGVIADDITGANDIGVMFAKHHWMVKVYADWKERTPAEMACGADVLVLDTDSRYATPQEAASRVRKAAQVLQALDCSFYYKKTCSVFRGNIGCEFDALLDTVGESFSLVVAAYPKNGRSTLNGRHFVDGIPLQDTTFAQDPINPMTTSDLLRIIAQTSSRSVALLPITAQHAPNDGLANRVSALRNGGCAYVVCDCLEQHDLRNIAAIVSSQKVFCGSAALAEELPAFWTKKAARNILAEEHFPSVANGGLIVAGSVTPQTRAQITAAASHGMPVFPVDTCALLEDGLAEVEIRRVAALASTELQAGHNVIVHAKNTPQDVINTRQRGSALGLQMVDVSRLVSQGLAVLTQRILKYTGTQRLVLAGGDTSSAICRKIGIAGNWVLEEIQPGVPSGLSIGEYKCLLVLKSGSFGDTDFFVAALRHLEALLHKQNNAYGQIS